LKEAERNADIKQRNDILKRIAQGAKIVYEEEEEDEEVSGKPLNSDDEDEDDAFMQEYRRKRLQGKNELDFYGFPPFLIQYFHQRNQNNISVADLRKNKRNHRIRFS
jgi:hypothetical protein